MPAPSDVFVPPEAPPSPAGPVFTVPQITVATFLGSPIAGAVLLGLNGRSLGLNVGGPVAGAVFLTFALFVGAAVTPDQVPGVVFSLAGVFATRALAESTQGPAVQHHLAAGGAPASWWIAVGVGLVLPTALIAVLIALVFSGALAL